jgi:hypothetical protein
MRGRGLDSQTRHAGAGNSFNARRQSRRQCTVPPAIASHHVVSPGATATVRRAAHRAVDEILAKPLDDADFARFGDLAPKKSLCFQWPNIRLCKFSQIFSWPEWGISRLCSRKNLESSFFEFRRLGGGGFMDRGWFRNYLSMIPYFPKHIVDGAAGGEAGLGDVPTPVGMSQR